MLEREFKILGILNKNSSFSQREIASQANVSVGTINSIIKQLVKDGFISVKKTANTQHYLVSEKGVLFLENYIKGSLNRKIVFPTDDHGHINQAVILAAGERLDFKKPVGFLNLGEHTIVERTITLLYECGIQDIVIITGYESQYYEDLAKRHKKLRLIKNKNYRWTGTMNSLALAQEFIKDDFILIESDIIFEKKALVELIENKNRNCLLITNESGSEDEVFVEIRDGFIFKMSKDRHQFNKIDGEVIGVSKISKDIYEKMLEEFSTNQNPYFNYEYALLDVARTFSIGYTKLTDLIWTEIDTKWHYKNLLNYIYPMLLKKEKD
ncbi:winged helix-turn-helix transcriptional regulator [Neobacillus sp. OS1-2]|uniref:winged helix-turn-helix transcriptional regulator n=1 Tax=Neobacillus sp. OS1-2 TaxID=3070680 RepID=UPI0027DFEF84|nr:winged helix-turn-helix transcriptional regulator [Neobacillus sp. OS1-2]WML41239.1 winged helix-turn-helix transcriptional regulator [Neobacillus sp. OS1-2]